MKIRYPLYIILCILPLTACSATNILEPSDGGPGGYVDTSTIPNAQPKYEPKSAKGNPASYCVSGQCYHVLKSSMGYDETGIASWYGTKFHNHRTANGEIYNMFKMTAAHKTLPIPTYAEVTNLQNGKQVVVKINDRGPFASNRLIDLSYTAAKRLGILATGTGLVEIKAIDTNPADKTTFRPANRTNSLIYLQIGAYNEEAHAKKIMKLAQNVTTTPCHIFPSQAKGHKVYRVKIGPVDNDNQANQITQKLKTAGLT